MALSQTTDAVIQDLLQNNVTSLQLEQFASSITSPSLIWCDVLAGAIRPVVLDSFRKDVFHKLHFLSDLGITSTIQLISQRFVWSKMKKDIRAWVRECTVCQANKIHRHNCSEFKSYALPTARFQEIDMDIVGPLPPSNGYKYLLTAIDRFTRFLTAVPIRDCTAQSVIDAFLHSYIILVCQKLSLQIEELNLIAFFLPVCFNFWVVSVTALPVTTLNQMVW